jgi:ribosomal protein L37AE/L43A
MSALTTARAVHHACGHTHRYVLHLTEEAAEREAHRLEREGCPACARTTHSRTTHPAAVDSGLGLQPDKVGDPNNLV